MKIYKAIIILTLVCMGLSIFLYYEISQEECAIDKEVVWQFVVWKYSEYCYPRSQIPKTLKIWGDFDTLKQCEEYLSLTR